MFVLQDSQVEELNKKYSRVSASVDFRLMLNTTIFVVGTGASGHMIEELSRIGIKRIYLFDLDSVESKNLVAQNFTVEDVGSLKTDALSRRLRSVEFEKGNCALPSLEISAYGDFLKISDSELSSAIQKEKEEERKVIIVMASDSHSVQARGNRLALKHKVATFFVGIYREGKASEIIIYGGQADLPCYRCITKSRYDFWDATNRAASSGPIPKSGTGRSTGLPMAATLTDAILGHLIVGAIHENQSDNQHAVLYRRIMSEGRNFIQIQLHPGTLMGSDDIFGAISNDGVITFNALFQKTQTVINCRDCWPLIPCHGFGGGVPWESTLESGSHFRCIA